MEQGVTLAPVIVTGRQVPACNLDASRQGVAEAVLEISDNLAVRREEVNKLGAYLWKLIKFYEPKGR